MHGALQRGSASCCASRASPSIAVDARLEVVVEYLPRTAPGPERRREPVSPWPGAVVECGCRPVRAAIDLAARRVRVRQRALDGGTPTRRHRLRRGALQPRGHPGDVTGAPQQRTLLVHLVTVRCRPTWTAERGAHHRRRAQRPRAQPRRGRVGVPGRTGHRRIAGLAGRRAALAGVRPPTGTVSGLPGDDARRRALVVRTSLERRLVDLHPAPRRRPGRAVAPAGIDIAASAAPFSFTVDCPSDLDCAPATERPAAVADLLPGTISRATTRRCAAGCSTASPPSCPAGPTQPGRPGRHAGRAVRRLGDRLAYWQDAVAVEAYLGTARRRTSVRRHARLLDYHVHEGCSARTLLAFTGPTSDLTPATAAPPSPTCPSSLGCRSRSPVDAVELGGTRLRDGDRPRRQSQRNALPLHAWGDPSTASCRGHGGLRRDPDGHGPRPAGG